jgi:hypothetical protein
MLVIEFQLVESSSMAKTFRAKELCLIESKTATRAVLSECASNDSCSVSWMVLRQRFAFHCGDPCNVVNTAFLWRCIMSRKCMVIWQMVLLSQINSQ